MMVVSQWCVNGRCESTSKNIGRTDSLQHNSEAGGWSSWSRWGPCSRTCGAGAAFRTRRCNNPRPSYGGAPCRGNSEEFRLCNIFRSVLSSSPHCFIIDFQMFQTLNHNVGKNIVKIHDPQMILLPLNILMTFL